MGNKTSSALYSVSSVEDDEENEENGKHSSQIISADPITAASIGVTLSLFQILNHELMNHGVFGAILTGRKILFASSYIMMGEHAVEGESGKTRWIQAAGPAMDCMYGIILFVIYNLMERRKSDLIVRRGQFAFSLWFATCMFLQHGFGYGFLALFGDIMHY